MQLPATFDGIAGVSAPVQSMALRSASKESGLSSVPMSASVVYHSRDPSKEVVSSERRASYVRVSNPARVVADRRTSVTVPGDVGVARPVLPMNLRAVSRNSVDLSTASYDTSTTFGRRSSGGHATVANTPYACADATPDAYWSGRNRAFSGFGLGLELPFQQQGLAGPTPAAQIPMQPFTMPMPTDGSLTAAGARLPAEPPIGPPGGPPMSSMMPPYNPWTAAGVGYNLPCPYPPPMHPAMAGGPPMSFPTHPLAAAPGAQLELGKLVDQPPQATAPPHGVNMHSSMVLSTGGFQPTMPSNYPRDYPTIASSWNAQDSEGGITTLMLRNIPVKYNREMMLSDMDRRGFWGTYDFFYLPIDFQTGNTVGYAFINFVNSVEATRFRDTYQGLQLSPDSTKICEVGVAKAQGKANNVEQYRNSSVMAMEERFKPVIFENGTRATFPPPTRILKPVKPRMKT